MAGIEMSAWPLRVLVVDGDTGSLTYLSDEEPLLPHCLQDPSLIGARPVPGLILKPPSQMNESFAHGRQA